MSECTGIPSLFIGGGLCVYRVLRRRTAVQKEFNSLIFSSDNVIRSCASCVPSSCGCDGIPFEFCSSAEVIVGVRVQEPALRDFAKASASPDRCGAGHFAPKGRSGRISRQTEPNGLPSAIATIGALRPAVERNLQHWKRKKEGNKKEEEEEKQVEKRKGRRFG